MVQQTTNPRNNKYVKDRSRNLDVRTAIMVEFSRRYPEQSLDVLFELRVHAAVSHVGIY